MPTERPIARVMIWIDGVGGYLTCLGQRVTIGQAIPDTCVEIPLQADLSRSHVQLTREDDQYILSPLARTRVNGATVTSDRVLSDGDQLLLGSSTGLRFRQPNPLSSSARLELTSPHRPWPAADGILLMGQSLILGPGTTSHVVCKDWASEVILTRHGAGGWTCRTAGSLEVDGRTESNRAEIELGSRVCGEDFCFTIEALG